MPHVYNSLLGLIDAENNTLATSLGLHGHFVSGTSTITITSAPAPFYVFKGRYRSVSPYDPLIAADRIMQIKTTSGAGVYVASLNVIDSHSRGISNPMPVVLAVGINYGQHTAATPYVTSRPVPLVDNTRMVKNAGALLASFGIPAPQFHLVAANFFPWITNCFWSSVGSLEEAILLSCFGGPNATQRIADLIRAINPEYVIFHGLNCAVPILGTEVIRLLSGHNCRRFFCGNLQYASKNTAVEFL